MSRKKLRKERRESKLDIRGKHYCLNDRFSLDELREQKGGKR